MTEKVTLTISEMGAQGDGIAFYNGVPVFVAGTMPGDVVDVTLGAQRKNGIPADLSHFTSKSEERVPPRLSAF